MRALRYLILLAAFLVGCASQTLSQQIAGGYTAAEQYLDRTERLYDAGAITTAEARSRVGLVRNAKTGLDAAAVALVQCRAESTPEALCGDAANRAAAAQALLTELEIFLLSRER